MKQNSLFYIIIGILVLFNVIMLATLWFGQQRGRIEHPMRPENFLERRLHLNQAQVNSFRKSREAHLKYITSLQTQIGKLRNEINNSQLAQKDSNKTDSLINDIGLLHMKIERANMNHFHELRNICSENQRSVFDSLFKRITTPPRPERHVNHPR